MMARVGAVLRRPRASAISGRGVQGAAAIAGGRTARATRQLRTLLAGADPAAQPSEAQVSQGRSSAIGQRELQGSTIPDVEPVRRAPATQSAVQWHLVENPAVGSSSKARREVRTPRLAATTCSK